MRATTFLFALVLAISTLLGVGTPVARASDPEPNRPGPNEVILHGDSYFGTGLARRFRIEPTMRQRTVYLQGQLLANNFRSVQVGSDVIATLYRSRSGRPDAGHGRHQLLTSATGLDPIYSILVINRKSDGRADKGYLGLPFRVTVEAQWSTTFGGGHLYRDDYFVGQTAGHLKVHDLTSTLLPGDEGADTIYLYTGRYPVDSLEAVLYDQPGAKGTNARTFPATPSTATWYSLSSFGFGDKARSVKLTWKGPEFIANLFPKPLAPMVPMVPVGKTPLLVPHVKGFWENQLGMRYQIGTQGEKFAWKGPTPGETGEGVFSNATDVEVRWTAADGSKHGPVKGKVERDAGWRATKFVFANGVVLTRAGTAPKSPTPPMDLTGSWNSKYGQVDLQHQGASLQGTLHYPNGGTASLQGTITGQTVAVTWFANPQAHGTGTFTIAPDGKTLSGPFTDAVSKAGDKWVLTR